MPIDLAPLSARTEDIPILIEYFKEKLSDINVPQPSIDINKIIYILIIGQEI